jgi:hypothetical protein
MGVEEIEEEMNFTQYYNYEGIVLLLKTEKNGKGSKVTSHINRERKKNARSNK